MSKPKHHICLHEGWEPDPLSDEKIRAVKLGLYAASLYAYDPEGTLRETVPCPDCKGTKKRDQYDYELDGMVQIPCPTCDQTGRRVKPDE